MSKQTQQMEAQEAQDIPATQSEEWKNAGALMDAAKQERKNIRKTLSVSVKQNTPIEQVLMSADLYGVVRDALMLSPTRAIRARLGGCEPVKITAENIVADIAVSLYASAKKAQGEGKLATICTLTERGVKADKYAFEFCILKDGEQ